MVPHLLSGPASVSSSLSLLLLLCRPSPSRSGFGQGGPGCGPTLEVMHHMGGVLGTSGSASSAVERASNECALGSGGLDPRHFTDQTSHTWDV